MCLFHSFYRTRIGAEDLLGTGDRPGRPGPCPRDIYFPPRMKVRRPTSQPSNGGRNCTWLAIIVEVKNEQISKIDTVTFGMAHGFVLVKLTI